mmetsp:Transcript_37972/g.108466  ORF Transcript_37972/g.108466 Transcript_37972/m.108466 type:complete len:300 (+) Transcript_37972:79-978(+)
MARSKCFLAVSSDSCTACSTATPAICCTSAGIAQICVTMCSLARSEPSMSWTTLQTCRWTESFALAKLASKESWMMSGRAFMIWTALSVRLCRSSTGSKRRAAGAPRAPGRSRSRISFRMTVTLSCTSPAMVSAVRCSTSPTCSGISSMTLSASWHRCQCRLSVISVVVALITLCSSLRVMRLSRAPWPWSCCTRSGPQPPPPGGARPPGGAPAWAAPLGPSGWPELLCASSRSAGTWAEETAPPPQAEGSSWWCGSSCSPKDDCALEVPEVLFGKVKCVQQGVSCLESLSTYALSLWK